MAINKTIRLILIVKRTHFWQIFNHQHESMNVWGLDQMEDESGMLYLSFEKGRKPSCFYPRRDHHWSMHEGHQ